MDINKLRIFCITAHETSIKKAAEKMGEKYTTFRKKLLTLETELNIPLFHHASGKVLLTMQGQEFLEHAKKIVSYADNQMALFHQNEEEIEGRIKISTSISMASFWIVDAIKDFARTFPNMHITILGSDKPANLFLREADVFVRTRTGVHDDYVELPLVSYHMNLYASEAYINKYGFPKNLQDLKNHQIISYGEDRPYPFEEINWHLKLLPNNFHPHFNVNSNIAILSAVENGLGIGSLGQYGIQYSNTKLIRILKDEVTGPIIKIQFCYLKNTKMTKSVEVLYEYFKNHFQKAS